jgi:hypothetical protein
VEDFTFVVDGCPYRCETIAFKYSSLTCRWTIEAEMLRNIDLIYGLTETQRAGGWVPVVVDGHIVKAYIHKWESTNFDGKIALELYVDDVDLPHGLKYHSR